MWDKGSRPEIVIDGGTAASYPFLTTLFCELR